MPEAVKDKATGTDEEPKVQEQPMAGSVDQMSLIAGGSHKVTVSEVKLQGGSLPLEGQFELGEEEVLLCRVRMGKVEFAETRDNTGTVTKVIRRHHATLEHVSRAPEEFTEGIE